VCPTVAPPGVPCVKSPRVRCFTPVARCARDCFGDTPPGDSPKWAHPGRAPPCGSPNPGVECLTWAPFRVGNKTARVGIPKPAESSCVPATFLRFREPPGPNRSPSPGPKLARFPVTESLLNPYPRSRNFPDWFPKKGFARCLSPPDPELSNLTRRVQVGRTAHPKPRVSPVAPQRAALVLIGAWTLTMWLVMALITSAERSQSQELALCPFRLESTAPQCQLRSRDTLSAFL